MIRVMARIENVGLLPILYWMVIGFVVSSGGGREYENKLKTRGFGIHAYCF